MAANPPTETSPSSRPPKRPGEWLMPFGLGLGLGVVLMIILVEFVAVPYFEGQGARWLTSSQPRSARPPDPYGSEKLTFNKSSQNHYFRENSEAGTILVVTGLVTNGYAEARDFIRVRGVLMTERGEVLEERYVYAGRVLPETELAALDRCGIFLKLSVRDGLKEAGRIEAGAEVPFMVVFDGLPSATTEYRIEPSGSGPLK